MFNTGLGAVVPPMVSVFTKGLGWIGEDVASSSPGSASFESAARAIYFPIILPAACVVRRVWWANGSDTTGAATVEVGVYADSGYSPGAKLVSGAATQGTGQQLQFVDVTDTALSPGLYWIAIVASTASSCTFFMSEPATSDARYRFQQASASPLPTTATPVESTGANVYLCGFSTTASP